MNGSKIWMCICSLLIIYIRDTSTQTTDDYLPTVLWHGMGDSCCNPFSMGRLKRLIEDRLPGIYVYSIMVGSNVIVDTTNGFFGNMNEHLQGVCDKIHNDTLLQGGFNAVGFSQGSQFLRALVQRCPNIQVRNLVSFGGQHQGIFGLPKCPASPEQSKLCEYIRELLDYAAYEKSIQNRLVQAQYWHDPLDAAAYREGSIFIADINNENGINEDYRNNMMALANFSMVKFLQDTMVVPVESEWFGFYAEGQDDEILNLQDSPIYLEDRLGLKAMDEAGKLQFLEVDGDHLQFDDEWFLEEIVDVYLA